MYSRRWCKCRLNQSNYLILFTLSHLHNWPRPNQGSRGTIREATASTCSLLDIPANQRRWLWGWFVCVNLASCSNERSSAGGHGWSEQRDFRRGRALDSRIKLSIYCIIFSQWRCFLPCLILSCGLLQLAIVWVSSPPWVKCERVSQRGLSHFLSAFSFVQHHAFVFLSDILPSQTGSTINRFDILTYGVDILMY